VTATSKRRYLKVLPEWFDLKKYVRVAALDAEHWNFQIAVRYTCFDHLCAMQSHEPYLSEWDGAILKALGSLRSNPFAAANSPPFDHEAFSWCYETPIAAVRSMTRFDLYNIDLAVKLGFTSTESELYHELVTDESPFAIFSGPYDWLHSTVDEDCAGLTNMPIMIDLAFPNKVLRQHFEIYLHRLRRRKAGRPEEAKKQSPDLDKWGKAGVLPCVDLLLWEKELDSRIPDSVLARALGPQGQVDREMIRKTVRPLAEALVSPSNFQTRLGALAYSDLAERAKVRHRRIAKCQSNRSLSKNSTT
jgi:hypothetical protein